MKIVPGTRAAARVPLYDAYRNSCRRLALHAWVSTSLPVVLAPPPRQTHLGLEQPPPKRPRHRQPPTTQRGVVHASPHSHTAARSTLARRAGPRRWPSRRLSHGHTGRGAGVFFSGAAVSLRGLLSCCHRVHGKRECLVAFHPWKEPIATSKSSSMSWPGYFVRPVRAPSRPSSSTPSWGYEAIRTAAERRTPRFFPKKTR